MKYIMSYIKNMYLFVLLFGLWCDTVGAFQLCETFIQENKTHTHNMQSREKHSFFLFIQSRLIQCERSSKNWNSE